MQNLTFVPFIGISRNRLATDGVGVTTLAAFWGCPLSCKYCLNPQSLKKNASVKTYTPEELYHLVKIDQLYFLATGGGITFGGGEPCLYPDFIKEFRACCGEQWNITMETSLNVPLKNVKALSSVVDDYIVDIKDLNPEIYEKYTGKTNRLPTANLKWLIEQGKADKIRVRVPLIPNYNSEKDTKNTVFTLKKMGIKEIETFSYIFKK
ncbi:MAG: radical SAM protein [Lentimicrobiaceae bacterium]|nr:radical SAM protein [Lentimicrobiaceae bacterium]